jgi:nicotinamide riboside transporter PnuC
MDFIAGFFELFGLICIGQKSKFGFISNFIGSVVWVYIALTLPLYGLLLVVVPALFINSYNFYLWSDFSRRNREAVCKTVK